MDPGRMRDNRDARPSVSLTLRGGDPVVDVVGTEVLIADPADRVPGVDVHPDDERRSPAEMGQVVAVALGGLEVDAPAEHTLAVPGVVPGGVARELLHD